MLVDVQPLVWYVSYGSNLCRDRLMCYLRGGRPPGAHRTYTGARDHTPPRSDVALDLPGTVYFAGESPVWGGGVAFYDHDRRSRGAAAARAYLITAAQFVDVAAQEMGRTTRRHTPSQPPAAEPVGDDASLEHLVAAGLPGGRYEAGPGAYETLIEVGRRNGVPMVTFTAPYGSDDVEHTEPSPAYRAMIAAGLHESHRLNQQQIDAYFARLT